MTSKKAEKKGDEKMKVTFVNERWHEGHLGELLGFALVILAFGVCLFLYRISTPTPPPPPPAIVFPETIEFCPIKLFPPAPDIDPGPTGRKKIPEPTPDIGWGPMK